MIACTPICFSKSIEMHDALGGSVQAWSLGYSSIAMNSVYPSESLSTHLLHYPGVFIEPILPKTARKIEDLGYVTLFNGLISFVSFLGFGIQFIHVGGYQVFIAKTKVANCVVRLICVAFLLHSNTTGRSNL